MTLTQAYVLLAVAIAGEIISPTIATANNI